MTRLELDLGSIGKVTVEGATAKEIIEGLGFWQSLPTTCQFDGCDAPTHLVFDRVKSTKRETYGETFDYYRVRCSGETTGEQHEVTLGEHKDKTLGLYYPESKPWTARKPRQTAEGEADEDAWHQEPPQEPEPPRRPAQAVRRPAPAQPADRQAAEAQRQAPIEQPGAAPPGLALRVALTRRYGIRGQYHALVAERALGRPIGDDDWKELTSGEAQSVEALAATLADGRLMNELRPA